MFENTYHLCKKRSNSTTVDANAPTLNTPMAIRENASENNISNPSEIVNTNDFPYLPRAGEEISEEDRLLPRSEFEAAKPKKRKYTEDGRPIYFNMTPSERRAASERISRRTASPKFC